MKLCYTLPKYNQDTATHFYHHYEFLEKLSNLPAGKAGKIDVFLIIEKGKNVGGLASHIKRIYVQRFGFVPLRWLESFFVILWAGILGYKNFYTHYCYIGGINAGIISRLFGGKSYYWHCEMIWELKQKLFSKIGLNLCLKLCHFLVTGSESLKKSYAKHFGLKLKNIKIVPNWINLKRFQKTTSYKLQATSKKTILFVHRLSERKGAHLLIPIVKQLVQNFQFSISNFQLLIIGDGPLRDKIEKDIKKNKLEKQIKLLGKIPNKDLIEYYAKSDIFIMPSLQEGFPRVLLEAMAAGVPYIASDVGAAREISPKTAQKFLIPPNDVKDFAKKIKILFFDKEIYNKFKREELEKVKEYKLEKVVNQFIKLFR